MIGSGNQTPIGLTHSGFEDLFRTHFKGLVLFARQYVKDTEPAREIVQDAFVSLWEKRESIDPDKPVKAYLKTSIYNKCLNYLRDNSKFSRDLLAFENLYPEPETFDSDTMVSREISEAIHAATEELPEKCREIFILSRHEQLRYKEIADRLQLSVKTVETQMTRALQHMRERLAGFLVLGIVFFDFILKYLKNW